jgi:tetratricopeptide (TPR) repeat protein
MEGGKPLDTARSSASQRAFLYALTVLSLLATPVVSNAQTSGAARDSTLAQIEHLFEQQQWPEVVRTVEALSFQNADVDYYYGSALAQLGRWEEARGAFLHGGELQPRDKRFPIELGGVAYKQNRYREAAAWLRDGLQIDPNDSYANDFLATIYFVQGNLEAALKYWNRINKPFMEEVHTGPELKISPVLLDHSFTFAPLDVLRRTDLLASDRRLQGLGIFPTYHLSLGAREDKKFDVNFQAQERNGAGNGMWQSLLSIFRGLPYQTIYPEYFNIGGHAMNFSSLLRWDAQKRRVSASLSSPLENNPKYRYQLGLDLRNENWDIRRSFTGPAPLLGSLNLRREAVEGSITGFSSGRWGWSTGAEFSHRDYRSVFSESTLTPSLLLAGYELKHLAEFNYQILRIPEQRLLLQSKLSSQIGAIWANPRRTFEKLQGQVSGEWFPQMQGDDYRMRETLRAGATFGHPPFDELFMLGLERDNDLWMRAHIGTRDGRKGSAPLGSNYVLSNWEIDKRVYDNGIFNVKLSPFLDTGRINGSFGLGSQKWLWDTGIQVKAGVLGVGVTFTYGKDLCSGNNAFYVTTTR